MAAPTLDAVPAVLELVEAAQVVTFPVRPAPLVRPHPACTCPRDPDGCVPCHGADWLDWCTHHWSERFDGQSPTYGLIDPDPLRPAA